MPSFWDTLKSVGLTAASTAGQVYQTGLNTFKGVASDQINKAAGGVQASVAKITKPTNTATLNSNPAAPSTPPAATPKKTAGLGIVGLLIAAAIIYFYMRKK